MKNIMLISPTTIKGARTSSQVMAFPCTNCYSSITHIRVVPVFCMPTSMQKSRPFANRMSLF